MKLNSRTEYLSKQTKSKCREMGSWLRPFISTEWPYLLWPANCIFIPLITCKTRDGSLFLALHCWDLFIVSSRISKLRKICIRGEKLSQHLQCLGGNNHQLIIDIAFVHLADIDMAINFASTAPLYARSAYGMVIGGMARCSQMSLRTTVSLLVCSSWGF